MDITVISRMDWTHPSAGGAETYLKKILFRLTESHDITLFCSKGKSLPDEETINRIRVTRCGFPTDNVAYINQSFIAYKYYRRQVSDDLLLVNGASQLYPLFRSKNRVDIYHLFQGRDSLEGGVKYNIKFGLEWLAMRLPKGRQIGVSENQKKKIEAQTPQEIRRVVNGGVDYKRFSGDVDAFNKPTLLHLGRLGAQKGTDIAIKVHRQVQQQTSFDVDFHICGTGNMDDLARQYAAKSETTTYHGYVSEEKKIELMQRSWLQLMPSRSEAFPLVVLEANAAGTPVISSDISGFTDSIEDGVNGFRCNSEEVVQTSIEILGDRKYQQQLSRSSQKYAEQYSWERTAKAIDEVIQSHASP